MHNIDAQMLFTSYAIAEAEYAMHVTSRSQSTKLASHWFRFYFILFYFIRFYFAISYYILPHLMVQSSSVHCSIWN